MPIPTLQQRNGIKSSAIAMPFLANILVSGETLLISVPHCYFVVVTNTFIAIGREATRILACFDMKDTFKKSK